MNIYKTLFFILSLCSKLHTMDVTMADDQNSAYSNQLAINRGIKRTNYDCNHDMGPERKKSKRYKDITAYVVIKNTSSWYSYKDFIANKHVQSPVQLIDNNIADLQYDYMVPVFVYHRSKQKQSIQTYEYNTLNGKDDVIRIKYLPYSWLMRMDHNGLRLLYARNKNNNFDTCLELHNAPCAKRGTSGKFEIQSIDDFKSKLNECLYAYINHNMVDYCSDGMSF